MTSVLEGITVNWSIVSWFNCSVVKEIVILS